jgi:Flp pilus assembly protein TadG
MRQFHRDRAMRNMMKSISFSRRKQRGQSLVEMGLMLTALLWLLSGAIDFGIGFFSYVAIRDAAQEGALFGSIDPTGDIEARVRASSTTPVNLADTTAVHITVTLPGTVCSGNPLTVLVTYDYPVMMPIMTIFTGPTVHLRASATTTLLIPYCP